VEKLTLAVLVTGLAELIVIGKKELHAHSSCCGSGGRGDGDLHAVGYRIDAAGHQASCALYFYETHAAGTLIAFAVVERAQRRDLIAALTGGFQNGHSRFDLIGNAFDLDIYQCHVSAPPYFFSIAPKRQVEIHIPHLIHFS
jgi:hypothetical protein